MSRLWFKGGVELDSDCDLCVAIRQGRWSQLDVVKSHAEDGCPYCSLMFRGLTLLVPDVEIRLGFDASFRFKGDRELCVYTDPNGSLRGLPEVEIKLQYKFYKVGAQNSHGPPGGTSSEEAFTTARKWIHDCLTNHKLCGVGDARPLPTRILDIGEDQGVDPTRICVVESSSGQTARYIALSHSWGGDKPIITERANLEDHIAGMPFSRFPKTFQDAVRITRKLGIRYLWIDSLCIIQDDQEDWEHEASRMAGIYRDSWLTLSGVCSTSPNSGIFRQDQAIDIGAPEDGGNSDDPIAILFPAATELQNDLRLSLRFAISHPDFDPHARRDDTSFPLMNRAWAYQERLLPSRVLHFGPQELFWECMQSLDCHCGQLKWRGAQHMGSYVNASHGREDLPPKISHYAALEVGQRKKQIDGSKRRHKLLSRWQDMVEEYTERRLSFATDRLPAFAGVAAEMVDALGMRYCAGLWAETMPIGLLWERSNCTEMGRPVNEARSAPSWSWASVDAPVSFLLPLTVLEERWRKPTVHASVEEIRCVPQGLDELGRVKLRESYVMLVAEVVQGSLWFERERSGKRSFETYRCRLGAARQHGYNGPTQLTRRSYLLQVGETEPIMFVPDVSPCARDGTWIWEGEEALYCAKILESDECFYWLVMKRIDDGEVFSYERIGVLCDPAREWETSGQKERIKLV